VNQARESLPTGSYHSSELVEKRKLAFFDIAYLLLVIALYASCLLSPLFGIVLGIAFLSGGATDETRRVGRICLILGIINIVLVVITMAGMIAMGGLMTRLPLKRYWEGL
jgi:hypothetical protein